MNIKNCLEQNEDICKKCENKFVIGINNIKKIKIFVSHKFKIVKLKNQFNAKSAYKAFY